MRGSDTNSEDRAALALSALGWTLADDARASRFLALTGIEPGDLRARIAEPALHEAVFAFLQAYQPDLIACAEALSVRPDRLVPAQDFA